MCTWDSKVFAVSATTRRERYQFAILRPSCCFLVCIRDFCASFPPRWTWTGTSEYCWGSVVKLVKNPLLRNGFIRMFAEKILRFVSQVACSTTWVAYGTDNYSYNTCTMNKSVEIGWSSLRLRETSHHVHGQLVRIPTQFYISGHEILAISNCNTHFIFIWTLFRYFLFKNIDQLKPN